MNVAKFLVNWLTFLACNLHTMAAESRIRGFGASTYWMDMDVCIAGGRAKGREGIFRSP
jgi:hypothetical protein